jgi:hypothetical protein
MAVDEEWSCLETCSRFYGRNGIKKGQREGKFLWLTADCWQRIVQVVTAWADNAREGKKII